MFPHLSFGEIFDKTLFLVEKESMREVKALIFDSLSEFSSNKGFSMNQVVMAEFIYLIKEKRFIKHRYAPQITTIQKPQIISDGPTDRICYRI